jgi:hypothetical protein
METRVAPSCTSPVSLKSGSDRCRLYAFITHLLINCVGWASSVTAADTPPHLWISADWLVRQTKQPTTRRDCSQARHRLSICHLTLLDELRWGQGLRRCYILIYVAIVAQIEAEVKTHFMVWAELSQSPNGGILPTARKATVEALLVGFGNRLRIHGGDFGDLRA